MVPYEREFEADLTLVDDSQHKLAMISHANDSLLVVHTFGKNDPLTWGGSYESGHAVWLSIEQVRTLRDHLTKWLNGNERRSGSDRRKGNR